MDLDDDELKATKNREKKCEYCNLVSGEEKDIGETKNDILKIERYRNSYYISAIDECIDYIEINYCPMCGRKLV